MNDTTVKASIDIGDNMTRLLEQLATQIGTTVDKIYPWYVQQAVVEGWTGAILFAVLFTVFGVATLVGLIKADWDEGNPPCFVVMVCGGILGFVLLIGTLSAQECVGKIINPNYYAMKMLTNDLSKFVK